MKFKIGDIVLCIDKKKSEHLYNQKFIVVSIDDNVISAKLIIGNTYYKKGHIVDWFDYRFKKLNVGKPYYPEWL